ncbi:MAG TPA: DUF3352 domain-containing protein, partial [Candidatus Limnocylindria bacterium]
SQLLDAVAEQRSGLMVVNSAAMLAELRAALDATQPGLAEAMSGYLDATPPYSVGSVSFADDAFLMDAASQLPDAELRPENSERTLAGRLPADTLFFADGSRIGPMLEQALVAMKATLAIGAMDSEQLDGLDQVETALGAELEEFVSWIGDGAVAGGWDGDAPWFGALLQADDADAAARRLNQLGALAELAAAEQGSGVQVGTETVGGVEVTTITFGGEPTPAVEAFAEAVTIQYALDGDLALLGVGDRFVEAALSQGAAGSLAESDRFDAAIDRFGGSASSGTFFLDLAGLREAVEGAMPLDAMGYAEVRENLLPLDYLAGVTRVDGDLLVSRMGLVLR